MAVNRAELEKLARLSRLSFSEQEYDQFAGEFDEIIAFADTINQSVEGGTEEIKSIGNTPIPYETLREDTVVASLPGEKIVSNVEDVNGFFALKKTKA